MELLEYHKMAVIEKCFKNSYLVLKRDDGAESNAEDYSRCAAFSKYGKEPDWSEYQCKVGWIHDDHKGSAKNSPILFLTQNF